MTAPDRIFVPTGSLNAANIDFNRGETRGLVVTAGSERWYEDDVEYIRKGAFPVEEIREAFSNKEAADVLGRILGLLEGEE